MEASNLQFPTALTFGDVLLLPGYTDFDRSAINLSTKLTKKITISIPLVSAPMDTVTEAQLAIKLAQLGGIGIIHRNLTVEKQAEEVKKVKEKKLLVGAAVGANTGFENRVKILIKAGADTIVVDSAHGFSKTVIDAVKFIKQNYKTEVIAGNIATSPAAQALIDAGADGLRVGMGPGSICTTRIISGMGVPQLTAIQQVVTIAKKYKVPVIADGGLQYSGDVVKALAYGASTVMTGSLFAQCKESPGKLITLKSDEVPQRFKSIFKENRKYLFKSYRGMGSVGSMTKGVKIKSEDEFHGKNYKDKVLVAEGVEGLVPVKGTVQDLVEQLLGGLKSGLYYVGAKDIKELWKKAQFIQITKASLQESHPHDILVTNAGKNY